MSPQLLDPQMVADTRRQLRRVVQRVAAAAEENVPPADFIQAFLPHAVEALGAEGGIWWQRQEETFEPTAAAGFKLPESSQAAHKALLQDHCGRQTEWTVEPGEASEHWLLFACISAGGQVVAVVEILQRPEAPRSAAAGYLGFLEQLCRIAGDYLQRRQLREQQALARLESFARSVHGESDLRGKAYAIANDGRAQVGADRLSVAVARGSRLCVRAISGQDAFDRRANVVKRLERLCQAGSKLAGPVWYPEGQQDLPPTLEMAIRSYLQESGATAVAVVPLVQRDRTVGVLVANWFEPAEIPAAAKTTLPLLAEHAGMAIAEAARGRWLGAVEGVSLAGGLRIVLRLLVVLAVLAAAGMLFAYTPAEFTLHGRGTLQPEQERDVFAATDGEVREILVAHGDVAEPDQLLVTLKNEQLELELQEIVGKRQQLEATIESLRSERLGAARLAPEEHNRLTSQLETSRQTLSGLLAEEELLRRQLALLEIHCPMRGQVITWNVADKLMTRPVRRGQRLLTVADLDGSWVLEVKLDEDRLGHLLAAQQQLQGAMRVSFVLATDPSVTYEGHLEQIANRVELDENRRNTVKVVVRINKDDLPADLLRPGASVTVRIHCGERSLGYVWFHDVWEWFQREVLFRLS